MQKNLAVLLKKWKDDNYEKCACNFSYKNIHGTLLNK